jgi:hypothetical protein
VLDLPPHRESFFSRRPDEDRRRRLASERVKAAAHVLVTIDPHQFSLNDRENILSALREKPLKVYEIMKRANVVNEEACQSLLLKMRDEGLVKFDIHKGRWLAG